MADKARFIVHSHINSSHCLYQDARMLHGWTGAAEARNSFEAVQIGRTAILLYIMSLEALINRAMEAFTPEQIKDFVMKKDRSLSLRDKWGLLPMLASVEKKRSIVAAIFGVSFPSW
jgi:hypothetical protein